jgi:hypothetical protein
MGRSFCRDKHQTIPMSPSRATSWVMHFRFELAVDKMLEQYLPSLNNGLKYAHKPPRWDYGTDFHPPTFLRDDFGGERAIVFQPIFGVISYQIISNVDLGHPDVVEQLTWAALLAAVLAAASRASKTAGA